MQNYDTGVLPFLLTKCSQRINFFPIYSTCCTCLIDFCVYFSSESRMAFIVIVIFGELLDKTNSQIKQLVLKS